MSVIGATLADLVARARSLCHPHRRVLLGITGAPGAGKTTLAGKLVEELRRGGQGECGSNWVARVPMDGFHLADVELSRLGRLERKGAADTFDANGYIALLRRLDEDQEDLVYAPAFDRDLEQPVAGSIPVPRAARLIITEGNYLLGDDQWAPVRRLLTETWFVEVAADERRRRLVARHEEFGKSPGLARTWSGSSWWWRSARAHPGRASMIASCMTAFTRLPGWRARTHTWCVAGRSTWRPC